MTLVMVNEDDATSEGGYDDPEDALRQIYGIQSIGLQNPQPTPVLSQFSLKICRRHLIRHRQFPDSLSREFAL